MGIVSKLFPREDANAKARSSAASDWIDLSDYAATGKDGEAGANTWIRFASLRQLDDLKTFSSHVYDGNILVLDFTAVQGDEIVLRRMTNELRKIATDTGGDIAGLGEHHILLTPAGVKVDRKKLVAKKDDDNDSAPQMRTGPGPMASSAPPSMPSAPSGPASPPRRTNGGRR